MAESTPTTGDLVKTKVLTIEDVDALVQAHSDKPNMGPRPLGEDYRLDVDAAIKAHPPTVKALSDPDAPLGWRRTMIRTAILLDRPVKA